jgi:hypothetical protein
VTKQLRLVEAREPRQPKRPAAHAPRGRATSQASRSPRRAINWGSWQLDDRTRRIGRAGVAAARKALEDARSAEELRRAS